MFVVSGLASLREDLARRLASIYPQLPSGISSSSLAQTLIDCFELSDDLDAPTAMDLWSERDSVLITYGDSVLNSPAPPLEVLHEFLRDHVGQAVTMVHILPFFPYSSDDGFAVVDYEAVNPELGDWSHIRELAKRWRIMGDLVVNHGSAGSEWFQQFKRREKPGSDYFMTAHPDADIQSVVRPRTSQLLQAVQTADGVRHVWCTFSPDQVDFDFRNPDVLVEFCRILKRYLDEGISVFRLDAVGFLWKEAGTTCIHLQQTHQIVRVFRQLVTAARPDALIITETNVPNTENLSYFGNRNEAHIIYNFSLAPLLLHALLTGQSSYLRRWMMTMPPAPLGCTYLNFTASHDGIGMRPAEGLIPDGEIDNMIAVVRNFGGLTTTRTTDGGAERVYELNVALFDALRGTADGLDVYQIERFICSQLIMLGLEGIPAFYIHSLFATGNDYEGVKQTGRNRSINRRRWMLDDLEAQLGNATSAHAIVFKALKRLLEIRSAQPAFHPNATQFTLQIDDAVFGFWRQSPDRSQSIFCISNLTPGVHHIRLDELNLISTDGWRDLITERPLDDTEGEYALAPYQTLWITNRPE